MGPADDSTGGGTNPTQLPNKTTEYDRWGNTAKLTEIRIRNQAGQAPRLAGA
ncbi:hypothetical protein [Streptomyces mirabilis]|uniref:hypothetical protein n=1 Tax=Streptomyces mirabilis TaxID=68239 RepID=UPI0036AABB6F